MRSSRTITTALIVTKRILIEMPTWPSGDGSGFVSRHIKTPEVRVLSLAPFLGIASVAQSVVRVLGKDEVGSSILPGGSKLWCMRITI